MADPGLKLHCVSPRGLVAEVARSLGPGVSVAGLPRVSMLDLRRRLHTFLFMLLASKSFSPFFERRVETAYNKKKMRAFILRIGRLSTPKLKGPALNRFLTRVLSLFSWRRTFPTRRVAVLTKCSTPHLLCNRHHEVVSILDGWDHPTTNPAGYWSQAVAAWNDDLADDWMRMQGADRRISGYPYRFAYIIRNKEQKGTRPEDRVKAGCRLLYAMATFPSESTLDQTRHEEEITVVDGLYHWFLPHVTSFEVKPHPIGPSGHLDQLRETCPGIVIHAYETSGPSTYDLTDSYNIERFTTLQSADVVIGIWTTFMLDAAMAGKAIALVDLPADTPLRALWTAQLGLHVHHLRQRVSAVISLQTEGPSFSGAVSDFEAFVDEAMRSGRRVADWVLPNALPHRLTRALLADFL